MSVMDEQTARGSVSPVVRSMTERDHAAIHEILTSPSVIDGTMRVPHAAVHETVDRLTPRLGTHHLVADVDGRAVGLAELITFPSEPRHRHVGELNLIATHPRWGRQGVGRALMTAVLELADDWFNIHRLGLVVFVDNTHAIELYQRLGFVIEGTMLAYGFKRGNFLDAHVMARVRGRDVGEPVLAATDRSLDPLSTAP
jgi:L-phenylalanine/L-methionine N-acetyltransferase